MNQTETQLGQIAEEYPIPFQKGDCFKTAQLALLKGLVPEGSVYCEGIVVCPHTPFFVEGVPSLVAQAIVHGFIRLPDGRILDPILASAGADVGHYVFKTYTLDEILNHHMNSDGRWQITEQFGKAWVKICNWLKEYAGILTLDFDLSLSMAFSIVSEEACGRVRSVRHIRDCITVKQQDYKLAKRLYYQLKAENP